MIELQQPPSTFLPSQRFKEEEHMAALPDEAATALHHHEGEEGEAPARSPYVVAERDAHLPMRAGDGPMEEGLSSLSLKNYSMPSPFGGMAAAASEQPDEDAAAARRVSTPSSGQSSSITLSTEAASQHEQDGVMFQEPFSSPVTWSSHHSVPPQQQQQQQQPYHQSHQPYSQQQQQHPHLPLQPIQTQHANHSHALYHSNSFSAPYHPYHHPFETSWVPGEGYGNVNLPPYSPQMLSPLETDFRRSSHPSHLYSDNQISSVPATAAAYYSPYYQHHMQPKSNSPALPTPKEGNRSEQGFSAAQTLSMPRRKTSFHPYYVPSQQQQQPQHRYKYDQQHHYQAPHLHHQQIPRRSSVLGIKMEHARSSPMIQPSSILPPSGSTTSNLGHGALSGTGPHYGRLPDGNIIELYPAMMRTIQACEYCRSRKAKCTGDSPCERCEKKGISCHYAQVDRKRKVKTLLSCE